MLITQIRLEGQGRAGPNLSILNMHRMRIETAPRQGRSSGEHEDSSNLYNFTFASVAGSAYSLRKRKV